MRREGPAEFGGEALAVGRDAPIAMKLRHAAIDSGRVHCIYGDIDHRKRELMRLPAGDTAAVICTGYVSTEGLVRHATMLVYPSLYEGRGLPVLEAYGCGVPAVGSATSSVVELVISELAFNPAEPASIAAAMHRLLAKPGAAARRAGGRSDRDARSRVTASVARSVALVAQWRPARLVIAGWAAARSCRRTTPQPREAARRHRRRQFHRTSACHDHVRRRRLHAGRMS